MAVYNNISSATTTTLITKGASNGGNIKKILITNHDDSDACVVKIQLNDGAGSPTIYVINETSIPARASLLLEDNLQFDSGVYNLQAVTSSTAEITIIIK